MKVSSNYNQSIYEVSNKCYPTALLRKSRKVTKAGETCHVYLPVELEGEEVIGVILKQ